MAKLCACVPIFAKKNIFAVEAGHRPLFMNSRSVLPVVPPRQHFPHLRDVAAIAITAIHPTTTGATAAPRVILAFSREV